MLNQYKCLRSLYEPQGLKVYEINSSQGEAEEQEDTTDIPDKKHAGKAQSIYNRSWPWKSTAHEILNCKPNHKVPLTMIRGVRGI